MRKFLLICIAGVVLFACSGKPPIRITEGQSAVVVDVQSLGEYPTAVKKIRLSEATTGEVIWELNAIEKRGGVPQLARFELSAGSNRVQIDGALYGTYEVVAPMNQSSFVLQRGVDYELELWGASGRSNSAVIQIR